MLYQVVLHTAWFHLQGNRTCFCVYQADTLVVMCYTVCCTKHSLNVSICFLLGVTAMMCLSVMADQICCFCSLKWYFVIFVVKEFHLLKDFQLPKKAIDLHHDNMYILFISHILEN